MTVIFVPKEIRNGESRVAATPETVGRMVKDGLTVRVESGAGRSAFMPDAHYQAAGADVLPEPDCTLIEAEEMFVGEGLLPG